MKNMIKKKIPATAPPMLPEDDPLVDVLFELSMAWYFALNPVPVTLLSEWNFTNKYLPLEYWVEGNEDPQ